MSTVLHTYNNIYYIIGNIHVYYVGILHISNFIGTVLYSMTQQSDCSATSKG